MNLLASANLSKTSPASLAGSRATDNGPPRKRGGSFFLKGATRNETNPVCLQS